MIFSDNTMYKRDLLILFRACSSPMSNMVYHLSFSNLVFSQTLANAVVKVVIPTERYFILVLTFQAVFRCFMISQI